ncbi:hypothetical protein FHR93_004911 [Geodermatophilus sabuli]|uniref:Uncharacterized protein n=1 Tax=Geodermatophilus sabuli TaxID=1564158 RepID=A0A285EHK2_9ACTN|nr:hypothetical protein [Geodermatophilus sabuli]SNX97674.1 hypothetical protein SAMN06893097_10839 [Geodermatophilus sabuli]
MHAGTPTHVLCESCGERVEERQAVATGSVGSYCGSCTEGYLEQERAFRGSWLGAPWRDEDRDARAGAPRCGEPRPDR